MAEATGSERPTEGRRRRFRALIADDDEAVLRSVARLLEQMEFDVAHATSGGDAIAQLRPPPYDVIVSDWSMPGGGGLAVLERARTVQPGTPFIMLTGQAGVSECVQAMKAGAFDFLSKPYRADALRDAVERALIARGRVTASQSNGAHLAFGTGAAVVGGSAALAATLNEVEQVAATDATVLITGETGSGKELIARLVHGASERGSARFVAVNCGALPATLIESELFGHARGAFTGASEARPGFVREADGGTLFLDEIGELPLVVQTRLLRVLQERQVTPVGADRPQPVDVRFIAATNRDLEAMVREGTFRADLYFRLAVVPIAVPPLRARLEDIPELVSHFAARFGDRLNRRIEVSARALALLRLHSWPGNIRELENVLHRAAILAREGLIDVDHLPGSVRSANAAVASAAADELRGGAIDLPTALARFEWALIDDALARAGGNRARAAALLGISRTTLVDKLKRRA